jgi:hypothetical protein
METTQLSSVPMIGETAGRVWSYLDKNGETSTSRMFRDLGGSKEIAPARHRLARPGGQDHH